VRLWTEENILKTLAVGTVGTFSAASLIDSCKGEEKVKEMLRPPFDRTPAELEHYNKLMADKFFDDHEMKTISLLADIIIRRMKCQAVRPMPKYPTSSSSS